jgi:ribosomal protein S12 methylthiotransferase accessory factor
VAMALERGAGNAPPIYFEGRAYRANKEHLAGTHRACSPEATLERIRPLLATAGITRIADITGLDRIGVPVVLAMRPNAPTLANSSGKGFTRTAATVSAAMEGIEIYLAEEFEFVDDGLSHGAGIHASFLELERDGLVCPIEHLPLSRCSTFRPDAPEDWVIGFDLVARRPMAVPWACVSMMPSYHRDGSRFSFQVGSNGLASGNVFLEALSSGLHEVIERDAVTCAKLRLDHHLELQMQVNLADSGFEAVDELNARFRRAGTTPLLFDCTADTAVPTYVAYLLDDLVPSTGAFSGYGAHLHSEVAMLRALTEAAQSRAVYIAGSRDDLMCLDHQRLRRHGATRQVDALRRPCAGAAPPRPSAAGATFEEDCATLLERVRGVGLERVIVVDLTPSGFPVSVVRVVVPGLEGYTFPHYTPGLRGLAAQREGLLHRQGGARA